ncbi:PREDICTED: TMV resistance protein N-like [Fragaria vesca subsp. vesca]
MSTERASSSVPSSSLKWKYDVFLSFRGKDTRKGFTNNLYSELVAQGTETFMDDHELQKGEALSPVILTAIEESRFAFVVLSVNYAWSTWCLDELLKILECMEARITVLPVFYDVDPSDVRQQTGSFAEAFNEHEKRFRDDTDKLQGWRTALTKISNFTGWNLKDWRYERDLIKEIVAVVCAKLFPRLFRSVENLVGIDSRVEAVHLLSREGVHDVSFIGILGMGGIGFFQMLEAMQKKVVLLQLQKKLISRMLGKDVDVWDVHEGAEKIKRFLRYKKVLLILDDVNHSDQLDYLARKKDWFHIGSVVIITTRNDHLLVKHGVERKFEVQGLSSDEALQLFSLNAFKRDYPEQKYLELSNQVLNYAKGLPLALKVLGSFLHGRGVGAWRSVLCKWREVCNRDIFETLKISYDGLDDKEKKLFLAIACYFHGKRKHYVIETLNACGLYADIGIDVLVERSLLTISFGTIWMHDLLQEMGLEIVRRESPEEPGKRSRLWLYEVEIQEQTVEAIVLDPDHIMDVADEPVMHMNSKSFSKMNKLRLLEIRNVQLSKLCDGLEYLSSELQILRWLKFPLRSLPSSFNPEKIKEINMCHSQIVYLWMGIKHLHSLKTINLSHSLNLLEIPDLSGSPYLECLILEGCIRLTEVDSSVGMLERLTLLNLRDCTSLCLLPCSLSGLKSLKVLLLSGCSKLDKLPEDLGYAKSLEELDVAGTAMRVLPSRLVKQGCNSVAFTSLKQHLQAHPYHPQVQKFEFVIPGNDIPEWFNHQSAGPLVTIDLPPGWFNNKLMGFAFCAVFAVQKHSHVSWSDDDSPTHEIHCQYEVNGKKRFHLPGFSFNEHLGQAVSDHIWIFCSSLRSCEDWLQIKLLFTTDGPGLQVKKCGVRIVYHHDEEEIMVNNVKPFTFSDFPSPGEVAIVSCATAKRGPEHFEFDFGSDNEADIGCGLLGEMKKKLLFSDIKLKLLSRKRETSPNW